MLTLRKLSKNISEICKDFNKRIDERVYKHDIVSCEVCGCLLYSMDAIKGKGVIKTSTYYDAITRQYIFGEDRIYYPYYCKIHVPEELQKESENDNK